MQLPFRQDQRNRDSTWAASDWSCEVSTKPGRKVEASTAAEAPTLVNHYSASKVSAVCVANLTKLDVVEVRVNRKNSLVLGFMNTG
jgi:hypothetical protein